MAGTRKKSYERHGKLTKGFPLGPEGPNQRVTKEPPKTSRGKKRGKVSEKQDAKDRQYDADTIQENIRMRKELGIID